MEYDEEDDGVAGSLPEFGAIFMSSTVTMKECLKRRIFALPSSQAKFVKHVKAGMVLFLFEFERRRLYGVYKATSDGATDIVPHAFSYAGKHFPAQVSFTPIWYCNPLSEKEFRNAIIENYFSPRKFHFGLNENQVHRLLSLFSLKKMKSKLPRDLQPEIVDGKGAKNTGEVHYDRFLLSERRYIHSTEYDEFQPATRCDDQSIALDRYKDGFLIDHGGNAEGTSYPSARGGFQVRRRIDDEDKIIQNDVSESEIGNVEVLQGFPSDSPKGSLDGVRRSDDARQLLRVDRHFNENKAGNNPFVLHYDYLLSPLDVRASGDNQFMWDNHSNDVCNVKHDPGPAFSSENYRKPWNQHKHKGGRFLFDEYVPSEQNGNIYSCRRDYLEDPLNGNLNYRYHLNYDGSEVSSFEQSPSLLRTRTTTLGGNTSVKRGSHKPEDSTHPLHCGQRLIDERKYPNTEGRITETTMDGILCSSTSNRSPGYFGSVDERVDGRFRMSQRAKNEEDIHTLKYCPATSMEYTYLPEQKQNIPTSMDKLPEKRLSHQLSEANKFATSSSLFEDATITRTVPYVPERPSYSRLSSSSMAGDWKSHLLQEHHYQRGFPENLYSSEIRSSPYVSESNVSARSLNIAPEHGDTNTSHRPTSFPYENSLSLLNPSVSMQSALNTSASVNYGSSSVSKWSLASLTSPNLKNSGREEGYIPAYSSKSSEGCFAFDGNRSTSSHVHWPQWNALVGKAKDSDIDAYDQASNLTSNNYPCMNNKNHGTFQGSHFNSSGDRRSVFSRLTFRKELQVGGEGKTSESNGCYMNASADEVMEMVQVQRGNSLKKRKFVTGKLDGESTTDEKLIQNHTEIISPRNGKSDGTCFDVAESVDEVPKETRVVSFKRRSDTKKTPLRTSNDSTVDNKTSGGNGVAQSSTVNIVKRKKLVRPVFGKVESTTDTTCTEQNSQLLLLDKHDNQSCRKAIRSETDTLDDKLGYMSATSHQPLECDSQEHPDSDVQKGIGADPLPSTSHKLEGVKAP